MGERADVVGIETLVVIGAVVILVAVMFVVLLFTARSGFNRQ